MINLKTPAEIAVMRKSNRIVAEILDELVAAVRPGITTDELDQISEEATYRKGAKPAFKNYKPGDVVYPKCLCVSVNNEIVHGIPSSRKLKSGDIVGLDFGVVYEGFFGDSARTVAVGPVPERVLKLLRVTRDSLYAGIAQARAGNRISDIARAVQETVESAGFSVVTDFAGHGIGRRL
ncbi:MAG TPA: type I methionyl aminopeptidase, partial [Sporolactobacillaceae bacterium]|nr:type I methionyl aminopeptidase [Sporolactobacillaceae bacterium]